MKSPLLLLAWCAVFTLPVHADGFGTAGNEFTIDFVVIGSAGNADDAAFDNSLPDYSSPHGGVGYQFRLGVYEVSQDQIARATASGLANVAAGAWAGSQPAANMTWFEAAAFVNWLNTSTGHQAAYDLTFSGSWSMSLWSGAQAWQAGGENRFRHKDAYYFLPSEDEWYKVAYHRNDGATANYWDFANGSDTAPDGIDFSGDTAFDAIYAQGFTPTQPNAVDNAGVASAYGTYGQNGNVSEWTESAFDGVNDNVADPRVIRGGTYSGGETPLRPYSSTGVAPGLGSTTTVGFRIASIVPEPSAAGLLLASGFVFLRNRRCR